MAKRKSSKTTQDKSPALTPDSGSASGVSQGVDSTLRAHQPWRRDAPAILALGLLVAVSYVPAIGAGFVWDDRIFTEAEAVREWSGLWNIWFSPRTIKLEAHYWPIVYTTFWLEHKLWGFAPAGYHVVNLLLHFVTTVVLWRLLLRLSVPGAYLIAAVFAVHPLHVESVVWVMGRKDLLSALFYLSAALVYLRFVDIPRSSRYLLALTLFLTGLLCKSIAITLPAALLIWHWWKQGRVTRPDLLRLLPFFLVGVVVAAADLAFSRSIEATSLDYSIIDRVWIAAYALWFYVGKLLWPTDLAVIYPHWAIRMHPWGYVLAAGTVASLLWLFRQWIGRGPLAGAAFFAVTLSPVLGFIDYGYMQFSFVADRYQYLAGIGVLAVLIGAAAHGVEKLPVGLKIGATGLLVFVLVLLGTLTWRQAGIYKDEITFYNHIISLNPVARDVHYNLGTALLQRQRWEEGLAAILIGLEQRPDNANAQANAGGALGMLGRYDEAEKHLRRALELDPDHAPARDNLIKIKKWRKQHEPVMPP